MSHQIIKIDNPNDWHISRGRGIGGSDCASVLGLNPYKSNVDLWKEKTGRAKQKDISCKPCIIYGKKAEDLLRELFILDYPEYQVLHRPYDIHVHDDYEFMRASLDGELFDNRTNTKGILEIKTTEIRQSAEWEKWENKIPTNYFCQVLHYFAIDEDYKFCKLKAQIKHLDANKEIKLTTKHYHLKRDDFIEDIEYLKSKEVEFWHYVEVDKEPPLILPKI